MFREHVVGMADREASVVRVERVVLLEMENEVGHMPTRARRTRAILVAGKRIVDSRTLGARKAATAGGTGDDPEEAS
jgi:hypothetical protein